MNQKNMKTRILSLIIICSFIFTMLPTNMVKAASYKDWKQFDSKWSSTRMGELCTFGDSGCKLFSIAMLCVKSGAQNEANFTPVTLRNLLENKGLISHDAYNKANDGNISSISINASLGLGLEYVGWRDYNPTPFSQIRSDIASLINQGYYVEVRVKNNGHSVAVDSVTSSDVVIMDPGYWVTSLKSYDGGIASCNYYKRSNTAPVNDTITGSGINAPGSLKVGQTFSITGTITSASSNLTNVSAGVYTTSGTLKTGRSVNPGSRTYNLSGIDPYVYFNDLSAGTYVYKVMATNAKGTTTLKNQTFTVGTVSDNLSIANYNTPSNIKKGSYFSIKGTITSQSSNITSVNCGVFNSSGTRVTGKTVTPNAKSYNLVNIDPYVYFNNLETGTYTYKVIAKNAAGQKTLVSKTFSVYA